MIFNTFQILDRCSARKEESLWQNGICDWDSFISKEKIKGISSDKKKYFDRQLINAKRALFCSDSKYFVDKLKSTESWRLYEFFKDDCVFLDIETEGVSKNSDITVVGLFDGIETKSMIKGINLDYRVLKEELSKYKLIITFNGSSFDLPFIQKRYDILPEIPHIDLRHCCARVGFSGGLKKIEKEMGIKRREIVGDITGGDALTLWKMYKACGDDYYLKLLVEYNEEDVINLKKLMNYCYDKLSDKLNEKIHCNKYNPINSHIDLMPASLAADESAPWQAGCSMEDRCSK